MASKDQPQKSGSATQPESIPVKYQFMGSLRRSTIGFPPKFHQLRKKLAKSFPEFAKLFNDKEQILQLVYTDDEGDEITITTNDELLTAYQLAHAAGKVLRFVVPKFGTDEPTKVEAVPAAVPAPVAAEPKKEPAATATATATAATPQQQQQPQPRAVFGEDATPDDAQQIVDAIVAGTPVHFDHFCDITGRSPIVGARYVSREHPNASVSEIAYLSLSDEEKASYELTDFPAGRRAFPKRLPRYVIAHARWRGVPVHRGVVCDATGLKPILGNRYQLIGQNYDLCQLAYDRLSDADKAQYRLIDGKNLHGPPGAGGRRGGRWGGPGGRHGGRHGGHHGHSNWRRRGEAPAQHWGVTCDKSGMCPIVGNRWHKRGENYDLCEAEYQLLPQAEREKFVCIKHPQEWRCHGGRGRGFWGGMGGGRCAFFGNGSIQCPELPEEVKEKVQEAAEQVLSSFFPGVAAGQKQPNKDEDKDKDTSASNSNGGGGGRCRDGNKAQRATAQFVKDLTVNDRSRKAPGEAFEKAWVMRAGKTGVPAGCSLVFIGGCDLNAPDLRVPLQNAIVPGDAFVLKIPFTAPQKPGHYRSFWRLQDAEGRRFGPRIWADIMVQQPEKAAADPSDDSAQAAPAMKFCEDVSLPDGAAVEANTSLRKTWLVATSSGWGEGCELRCTDQWSTWAGLKERVPPVPAGSQAELSITLQAPAEIGHYRTYWALFGPDGKQFGDSLFADFQTVPAVASASAAATTPVAEQVVTTAEADADTTGAKEAEPVAQEEAANGADLLQQILAGINVVPEAERPRLSDLLYRALQSKDFSDVIKALRNLNIEIAQ